MNPVRAELRQLIASRLRAGQTVDQAADAVMTLFYSVGDEWTQFDVTTLGHPGEEHLDQRSLVCTIPRNTQRHDRTPDRTVEGDQRE